MNKNHISSDVISVGRLQSHVSRLVARKPDFCCKQTDQTALRRNLISVFVFHSMVNTMATHSIQTDFKNAALG